MSVDSEVTCQTSAEGDEKQMVDLIMDVFVATEPLNVCLRQQGLNKPDEYRREKFTEKVGELVGSPYTVVAKHLDRVVGVCVAELQTKQEYLNHKYQLEIYENLVRFLRQSETVQEKLPEKFLHLQLIVVSERYQRMGISGKMLGVVLEAAISSEDCSGVLAEATGLFSQRLLLNNGFQCISEVFYADYKDSSTGLHVFQNTGPHPSLKLLLLTL